MPADQKSLSKEEGRKEEIKKEIEFDKYLLLMKNDYSKPKSCGKYIPCFICTRWKYCHCNGPGKVKLTKDDKKKVSPRVGAIIMGNTDFMTKTQLLKDASTYFSMPQEEITTGKLFYYASKGLIKHGEKKANPLKRGSLSVYPKNTPGLLYMIDVLQKQGFQLSEIKEYLDLTELKDINRLKAILEEDRKFNEEMYFLIGIDKEIKDYLIKNVPLNLINQEKILTKLDYLKKVIELRAYAELNYKEITNLIISNADKIIAKDKIIDSVFYNVLDNPEISINLRNEAAQISVLYKDPINKKVMFSEEGIEVFSIG